MQILNFSCKKIYNYNCYDCNIIKSIFDYWNLDIDFYFIDHFGFDYKYLKNKLHIKWFNGNGLNMIKDICGIKLENLAIKDEFFYISTVVDQLKKAYPIGIKINSYYLPWSKYYKEFRRTHYILIVGYDGNNFNCIDNYLMDEPINIKAEYLIEHSNLLIKYIKSNKLKNINFEVIYKYLKKVSNYNNIVSFADDLFYLLSNEINLTVQIEKSDLVFAVSNVYWSRIHFLKSLNILKGIYSDYLLNKVYLKCKKNTEEWFICKSLIMKCLVLKNIGLCEDIRKRLYIIAKIEDEISIEINSLINN